MGSNLYTKGGDKGETSLVGGTRLSKGDARIHLYGEVDELNSHLGYAKELLDTEMFKEDCDLIENIQNALFDLGSNLACEEEKRAEFKLPQITEILVSKVEKRIDKCDEACAPLKNFILPGGSQEAAYFHIVRTVCRRVERKMVESSDVMPDYAIIFVNRLSDYFFVLSRFINTNLDKKEIIWKPGN